jgi:carboxypeptidase family protein
MNKAIRIGVMMLLSSLCVFAQEQQPAENSNGGGGGSNTGSITGRVVNENGQPLANASVTVRPFGLNQNWQQVNTDREGAFKVSGLERAAYVVGASLASYITPPREPDSTQPTTFHVGDSVTLTLIKGGVITGTVTNATGDPLIAIGVRAVMVRDPNGKRLPAASSVRDVPTDDRGVYRFYGLPVGTYVIQAGSGQDYSRTGINPYAFDVPTYAPSSSRDTAQEIAVRAGEEIANVDIRYRGERGRTISGTVDGPITTDGAVQISLTSVFDGGSQWTWASPKDGERKFSFNGVADGDYSLLAQSYVEGFRMLSDLKTIKVKGADIGGLALVTKPMGQITGRFVLDASKPPECMDKRAPVFKELTVAAWHKDDEAAKSLPSFVWGLGSPVPADADGNFLLRNLAPGQYYFVTRSSAKYWYLQSIAFPPAAPGVRAKPVDATHVWTNLKLGEKVSGLTITLAQGAGSLRGQLVLADGAQRPPRLFAYLVPAEREKADEILHFFAAPVSAEGTIALNNVAPGRYWIVAQPAIDETVPPLTKLRLPNEIELRAKLRREAEAAKTEIEFKPCQNISDFQLTLKP